ncbi:sugar transferase [Actinomadura vinacea]|uniref:Sugar transferase n=1 Tax=Actinomadura vinacea TaxID=115336 RepID=A0ABN3K6W0_9ACTN
MDEHEPLHTTQKRLKAIWDAVPDMPGAKLTGPDWIRSPEKRGLDLLVATTLLPVYLPTVAVGASLMYFGDGVAPLFWQRRIGRNGIPFKLLKVRTMRDVRGQDASRGSADPRALPVGKVLRKVTIDQFTELVNVLGGDMAMANPRPLLPSDRGLMRDLLTPSEYREWDWASTIGRPGMYSTFGNESIRLEPQTEEYLRRRFECDVEDAHCASLERDMKILGDTAKIGWSFVGHGS